MYRPEFLENRSALITIIALVTSIATFAPFFIDHTFSIEYLEHGLMHIAAITFGTFLIIVSFYSYTATKDIRMFFTMLAFLTFTLLSTYLLHLDLNTLRTHNPASAVEDVALTLMVGFFAISVFWHSNIKRNL